MKWIALLLTLSLSTAAYANGPKRVIHLPAVTIRGHIEKPPTVVRQKAGPNGSRILTVKNGIKDIVWVWFECENVLSKHPVVLPPKRTSKVILSAPEPIVGKKCLVWKWRAQGDSHSVP